MSAGKGSAKRPSQVSKDQVNANWDAIFGKKDKPARGMTTCVTHIDELAFVNVPEVKVSTVNKPKEFLTKLAALCKEYKVESMYTGPNAFHVSFINSDEEIVIEPIHTDAEVSIKMSLNKPPFV